MSEVCRKLGARDYTSSHTWMSRRIKELGIDTTHFRRHDVSKLGSAKATPQEVLRVYEAGGKVPPGWRLTRALLEIGRAHICEECGIGSEWRGRPLVLHVDHMSAIRHDCTEGNLRFLCPNCHSQTETHSTVKTLANVGVKIECKECGKTFERKGRLKKRETGEYCSHSCSLTALLSRPRKRKVSKEEVRDAFVKSGSFLGASRLLPLTQRAVAKAVKKHYPELLVGGRTGNRTQT